MKLVSFHSFGTILVVLLLCTQCWKPGLVGNSRQRKGFRDSDTKLDCEYEKKDQCVKLPDERVFCRTVFDKTRKKCVDDIYT